MSSRRSIVWLLFFVVLAVAAHVLVTVHSGRAVVALRANVLIPESDRASLLEVTRRGEPSVVVVRSGAWRMVAPFAASVDAAVVLRALDVLAFAPISDVLTEPEMRRLGRTLADFGLDAPALRLAVRRDDRETIVGFGGATPAGDGMYASVSGRPGVCVIATNVFAALDVRLDGLRERALMADSSDTVSAVDIRRPDGRFIRVSRSPADEWQMLEPTKATVSSKRVASLLSALASARSQRFVWPVVGETTTEAPAVSRLAGYGLDPESAVTVTLTGSSGSTRYVSFGKNADADSVYALVQNGGAIATVSAELRSRLLAEAESLAELKLFPCDEATLASLSIADGDLVYLLSRTASGEWRLDSPVSAPADPDAVHALVQTILSLRTTEREENGLLVSVSTNTAPVAVSRDALLVQNRLEDLRSKTVLKLASDAIRRLTVTAAGGRQQVAVWDETDRTWLLGKPDGATLNGLALAGVLKALDPLQAQSVVRLRVASSEAGNYGLERPRWKLAVDPLAADAVRRNILIGAPAPGGGAYATVGSTDAVFILSDETVRALTQSFSTDEAKANR